jgi:antitoxin HicB
MKFNIILEEAGEGGYNVKVPALDVCFTQGDTLEEAIENLKLQLYAILKVSKK